LMSICSTSFDSNSVLRVSLMGASVVIPVSNVQIDGRHECRPLHIPI
jgi:hypothetical protein